jgi:hypothetical protein
MYALASDVNENGKAKGGDGLLGALQAGDAGDAGVSHVRVSCDADAIQRAKDAAWAAIGGGRGRAPSIASTALISEGNNSQPHHGRPIMTKVLSYRSADSSSAGAPAAVGRIPQLVVAPPTTPVGGPQVMPLPTANRAFLLVGDLMRAAAAAAAAAPQPPSLATTGSATAGFKGPNSGRMLSAGVGATANAAASSGPPRTGTGPSSGVNGIVAFRGLAGLTAAAVGRGGGTPLSAAPTPTNAERANSLPNGPVPSLPATIERLLAPLEDLLRPYDGTNDCTVLYLRLLLQQTLVPWGSPTDG